MSPPEKPVKVLIDCRFNLILWPIFLLIISAYLAPKALLCFLPIEKTNVFQTLKQTSMELKGSSPQMDGWVTWQKKCRDHMTDW